MDQVGTVKSWFDVKGFGFIRMEGASEDIFVHYTEVRTESLRRSLNPGQLVRFRLERRDRGLAAVDVEIVQGEMALRCHHCGQELPQ